MARIPTKADKVWRELCKRFEATEEKVREKARQAEYDRRRNGPVRRKPSGCGYARLFVATPLGIPICGPTCGRCPHKGRGGVPL
jgi:hypothetical protein